MSKQKPQDAQVHLASIGDKDALPVTVPFPASKAGRALMWALATAEALAYGDGRGVLVVSGKLWRDKSRLPEPGGQGLPGRVDLLSASAARAAGIATFAKRLLREIDKLITAYLGWEDD